ncbi:MAG: helix-turn-helix domain-containing protein [Campylobacterales bacterium]|nr:helix-turn-helix domain-containing protein [Campylobacterales bacterium]
MSAEKKSTNFSNEDFRNYIHRFSQELNIQKDKDIANELGISPASFYNFKKNDTFPYDKLVLACLKNGISLDYIFKGEISSSSNTTQAGYVEKEAFNTIPLIANSEHSIYLPAFIEQNEDNTIKAFIQNNIVFFIDVSVNSYATQGYYLLKKRDIYYVRYVEVSVDDTFVIYSVDDKGLMTDTKFELTHEQFENFEIIGSVIKRLSLFAH